MPPPKPPGEEAEEDEEEEEDFFSMELMSRVKLCSSEPISTVPSSVIPTDRLPKHTSVSRYTGSSSGVAKLR